MLLIVPHLFPAGRLRESTQDLRLPALEALVARGERIANSGEGVEAAVCVALGIKRQQDWPIAPMTLLADAGTADAFYWLRADPVHLRLLRDRVVLADSDVLQLTQEEAHALAATLRAHFDREFHPDPVHPQRWYLRYEHAPDLTTTPPSVAAGRNIEPLQPDGSDGRRMRALLNEVQMLFHAHPVNGAREARGDPAVTSLWVWGGGVLPSVPAERRPVFSIADVVRAIAAYGGEHHLLPERFDRLPANAVVVLDALAAPAENGDVLTWRTAAAHLDDAWFAPLGHAPGPWGPDGLRIVDPINGRGVQLHRLHACRVWRLARPLADVEWPDED